MGRQVKRLSGLEIDEVSLVDRPANQHGLVAIAKREEDDMPPIYDADGYGVDEDELEHGDVVYDESGAEYVFVEDGAEEENEEQPQYEESFGKSWAGSAMRDVGQSISRGYTSARTKAGPGLARADAVARRGLGADAVGRKGAGLSRAANAQESEWKDRALTGASRAARSYSKNPYKYAGTAAGAATVGGVGTAAARRHKEGASKSLGDAVFSELSKALTDNERDDVIAKAMDYVDEVSQRSDRLEELVLNMADQRDFEDYTELAKSYELPIDPEGIGGLMQRASQNMDPSDVQTLDRLFSGMGEIAKNGGFDQIGYDGYAESDVLSQVYAVAGQEIAKGETGLTQEQAVTALFSANPEAYEEYESEQRYYR